MQDTGHILFDSHGVGAAGRAQLEAQMKTGERTFRDASEALWGSLKIPFDDGFLVMQEKLELDPGFREFHEFCLANGYPFNVISAGLRPVLQRVLDVFLGESVRSLMNFRGNNELIKARLPQSTLSQTTLPSTPTVRNGNPSGAMTQIQDTTRLVPWTRVGSRHRLRVSLMRCH